MIWQLDFGLMLLLIATAIVALRLRDLLAAVVVLAAYSFFMSLMFAEMGAVDVAFTEATLGAGVTGVLFIAALFLLERRSED